MADLVEEFFKRDLTEVEHESLAKILESSPDEALRYEGLLRQNYLATGLPNPTLPQGLQSLPKIGAFGSGTLVKVLLLAAGLAALGAVVWKFLPRPVAEIPAPLSNPVPLVRPHVVRPRAVAPGQEGRELSVVVNAPEKSLVTVKVMDDAGKEVRSLFTGFVESGRWSFQWDGLLEDGSPARAGKYIIAVQSGAAHLTKGIQIKVRPSSQP